MFNHIKVLGFVILLSVSSTLFAQQTMLPKRILVNYEVTKNGQPFAKVREQFVVTENAYKVESVTKGIGVYALLGERKLVSSGEVTAQGLKPMRFELHQGGNSKKSIYADFDWTEQILRMTVKGKLKELPLVQGTQDLASFAYQFMFLNVPLKNAVTVTLTTGKKLNQYEYKINPAFEDIDSSGIQYKTLHLTPTEQNQSETKELWLAPEHFYLPVRIMMVDENGQKLEQTLTELNVE